VPRQGDVISFEALMLPLILNKIACYCALAFLALHWWPQFISYELEVNEIY
jgi:hypothetical protein